MDRKMDLDDVLSVSVKLRGLGYLLMQEQINSFPEDFPEIREGIGLLVLDLGRQLARIVMEQDRALAAAVAVEKSRQKGVALFPHIRPEFELGVHGRLQYAQDQSRRLSSRVCAVAGIEIEGATDTLKILPPAQVMNRVVELFGSRPDA